MPPHLYAQANKEEENKSVEHAGGHVVDDSTSKVDNVPHTTLASGTHSMNLHSEIASNEC